MRSSLSVETNSIDVGKLATRYYDPNNENMKDYILFLQDDPLCTYKAVTEKTIEELARNADIMLRTRVSRFKNVAKR